jgi:tetratricopeptide (TPR) repeat protein
MNNSKKEILEYLDNVSLFLLGITFFAFPLLFTSILTDPFSLSKQILLAVTAVLSIVVLSVRMIVEGRVRLRTTPLDLPVLLFGLVAFASAMFSTNRYDALISFVPLFFTILIFFIVTNVVRNPRAITFTIGSLMAGTTIATIISLLSFFKIYLLPFAYSRTQTFTSFGSIFDQAIFLAITLPIAGYLAWPVISPLFNKNHDLNVFGNSKSDQKITPLGIASTVSFAVLTIGLLMSVYMLATIQKPLILPFVTGFQTALAAISQDTGRILQGFLLGSGYGTYMNDFTRFKQAAYNTDPNLWSFTFFRSSSFDLELLATTGFVGFLSFLFIVYRVIKEKTFFLPIVIAMIAAFLLPLSFILQTLIFITLGFFAVLRAQHAPSRYADLEFYLVTLKHGLILAQPEGERAPHDPVSTRYGKILPFAFVMIVLALVGYTGYLSTTFVLSDLTFQRSLVAASQNNAQQTYNLQAQAIAQFPYRDSYHRTFSQTNLTIANAIASNQPKGSSPSAETQQQIVGLIQQSINYGRNAVSVSPQSALNWNALSGTYRSLIGFGQNAEQFAVTTNQQAIALDPSNPQQYISLGGVYYQLGLWDEAIRQFQLAANLKSDYSNAYYNLGHAYESKGDELSLKNAIQAYQIVASLTTSDKTNNTKVKAEIDALQKKIGGQTVQQAQSAGQQAEESSLNVDQPSTQLPDRDPKAQIQAPPKGVVTPTPTTSPSTTPVPTLNP